MLSTSTANESHEWDGFQAGVFSYEVRSGLYGAADADGDGKVAYREIAAFVERANATIPNAKYRPQTYVQPPAHTEVLLELSAGMKHRLEIDSGKQAHYFLEDEQGIRLAQFHASADQAVRLVRPAERGSLYLHRVTDQKEFAIPSGPGVVQLNALQPKKPRGRTRGAAHHAFKRIFELPFGRSTVAAFPAFEPVLLEQTIEPEWELRPVLGWGSLVVGSVAVAAGAITNLYALDLKSDVSSEMPHSEVARLNDRIDGHNRASAILYGVGATALVAALILLLWPEEEVPLVSVQDHQFGLGGVF